MWTRLLRSKKTRPKVCSSTNDECSRYPLFWSQPVGLSQGHLLHVYRVLNLQSESNKNVVNTKIFVFSFVIDWIKNKKNNMNKQTNICFLLVYIKLTSLNCMKNKKPKYLLSLTGNLRNERKMWVTSDECKVWGTSGRRKKLLIFHYHK